MVIVTASFSICTHFTLRVPGLIGIFALSPTARYGVRPEWRNPKRREDLEEQWKVLRRGWYLGGQSFLERLEGWLDKAVAGKRRESHSGSARDTHDERAAERLLRKSMKVLGLKDVSGGAKVA